MQEVGVFLFGEPARLPGLVVAKPKTVRMCFLTQIRLLLLLALLLRVLRAFLERLTGLTDRALDALGCFGFSSRSSNAGFRGPRVLCHLHNDVARALLVAKPASHWRRAHTLPAWALVDEALRDKQRVYVERLAGVFGLALRVSDGAAQRLLYLAGDTLFRVPQGLQRVPGALAANQVDHQTRLLRRDSNETRFREALNLSRSYRSSCHDPCLRLRLRSRGRPGATRRSGRAARSRNAGCSSRFFERRFHGVSFERARRSKFAQLVPDHLLCDVNGDK